MLIHEVCRECRLTKKAVEYYVEQGLIAPSFLDNGYRDFSVSDIERLRKIAVLRGLGLAVSDIQMVLDDQSGRVLNEVSHKKVLAIAELQEKQYLIERLAQDNNWKNALFQLEMLEKKQTILQRLLSKFPGHYGKYLSLHFVPFLNEQINTEAQQEALETIISYLDGVNIVIPDDLKEYLDEATKSISGALGSGISQNLSTAVQNAEQYMVDNKDALEQYMKYMKSDEYKQSTAYRLKEYLSQFNSQSGYDTVFIPAMKILSNSYRQYHDDLLKANAIFLKRYGDELEE